jgi:hypothetical protein
LPKVAAVRFREQFVIVARRLQWSSEESCFGVTTKALQPYAFGRCRNLVLQKKEFPQAIVDLSKIAATDEEIG